MGIDRDEDGVLDGLDNCADTANVSQLDTDGDQIGNACDDDDDGDGLPDVVETNTGVYVDATHRGTDPLRTDSDGDGVSDGVETGTSVWNGASDRGTSPVLADTDGDGLSDGIETNTGVYVSPQDPGTNPLLTDTDGDGYSDPIEIAAGSNPNDALSIPQAGQVPALPLAGAALLALALGATSWRALARRSRA
jgi:hypothetical protein